MQTIRAREMLAVQLHALGLKDEEVSVRMALLGSFRRTLGPENPSTLACEKAVVYLLTELHRKDEESLTLFRQFLARHWDTLTDEQRDGLVAQALRDDSPEGGEGSIL
jgi:hypothetical protein